MGGFGGRECPLDRASLHVRLCHNNNISQKLFHTSGLSTNHLGLGGEENSREERFGVVYLNPYTRISSPFSPSVTGEIELDNIAYFGSNIPEVFCGLPL